MFYCQLPLLRSFVAILCYILISRRYNLSILITASLDLLV